MGKYNRTLEELRQKAVRFWPDELKERAAAESVLPVLLETQEKFLSLLKMADAHPEAWIEALPLSKLPGNSFLKHAMVLSDLGGEALNKIAPLEDYLNNGVLEYVWQGDSYAYHLSDGLRTKSLTNSALRVDGANIILKPVSLDAKMRDVLMLIFFGAQSINNILPSDVRSKCVLGGYIGLPAELEQFVRQSYIRISRQLGGADSNALGQHAQKYVLEMLRTFLPHGWELQLNGVLPGVSHNAGKTDSTFDIAVKAPSGLRFGVEISFQFTTNSVIERKSAQAQARRQAVYKAGHHIAYVLDGAGNIDVRAAASSTICTYSDCTVAFSESEIAHLAEFMREQEAKR
jgi:hypothetical protein